MSRRPNCSIAALDQASRTRRARILSPPGNYVPVIAIRQAWTGDSPGGPIELQLLEWRAATFQRGKTRRMTMKNPLDSLWGTIISGLVLTAVLYFVVKNFLM
jgi:hypothetical protein